MAVAQGEIDRALELFEDLGPLSTRKMMGGLCIYRDGTIFALLYSDGTLHLKCTGPMAQKIEDMGGTQWTYQRPGKKEVAMPYWTLPDAALDDPALACELASEALMLLESP